jgi:hypothetical protein
MAQNVELQSCQEDKVTWNLTANGEYTTTSTYKAQLLGTWNEPNLTSVWRRGLHRNVCFSRGSSYKTECGWLARRGWQHNPICLCAKDTQKQRFIWWQSVHTRGLFGLKLQHGQSSNVCNRQDSGHQHSMISWAIWNERNDRIFRNEETTVMSIATKLRQEMSSWISAGAKSLELLSSYN